ncbi:peptidylprolyl isomerase [Candidatus Kaiserbacteria bacterium CG10_big_fil_rev_8_21_14_0_10_49_17]|uniref:Peptidyl-prolyl cis-trans isomerase n=1 Tax=Candidatus Kaiserbacteria bacterium CG10_big_fil_rev_8_21_14_0_10_49_17 TaxID=1974609 RepID=A0A2M6WFD9_9BACT|nr:MAG: peptidylprolyl isomerase [Candidatus Kaiserbacteria bacterium CG10_big_fil_rev_8_21_14_0_10_49_17]
MRSAGTTVTEAPMVDTEENSATVNQLHITDIQEGTGSEAKAGDTVSVHYVGTLTNGQKFDSSKDRGEPFSFTLGTGSVIAGWEQGVVGMKVGGVRKLVIPSSLAYSAVAGHPLQKETLVFEVELLGIE